MTNHFRNQQWKVTGYGLESIRSKNTPTYTIEAKTLLSERGEYYDLPVHTSEKEWVNYEQFLDAYYFAVKHHLGKKLKGTIDVDRLERSSVAGWVNRKDIQM